MQNAARLIRNEGLGRRRRPPTSTAAPAVDAAAAIAVAQTRVMSDRGEELLLEILRLCDGVDAVEAITALTTALGVLVANAATADRVEPLTRDVIRTLETSVREMRERVPTVN